MSQSGTEWHREVLTLPDGLMGKQVKVRVRVRVRHGEVYVSKSGAEWHREVPDGLMGKQVKVRSLGHIAPIR